MGDANAVSGRAMVSLVERTKFTSRITVFRNVMKRAIDQKLITHLPTENLRPLKSKPRKRQLVLREQIDLLLCWSSTVIWA